MEPYNIPNEYQHLVETISEYADLGIQTIPKPVKDRLDAFLQEGPESIERWCDEILEIEASIKLAEDEKRKLLARMRQKEERAKRMREVLVDVISTCFDGKVVTPRLKTVFVRDGETLVIR